MARTANRLTAKTVEKVKEPGMHNDGDGLYLRVTETGTKSWLFRFKLSGKARAMGLGPFPDVMLADAREKARGARKQIAGGIDPIDAAKAGGAPAKRLTFDGAAAQYIASHKAGWRNAKTAFRWESALTRFAGPVIGGKDVATITVDDVLKILSPIWSTKNETASKLRGRIENILDWCAVKGHRDRDRVNPAAWKGNLQHLLPARSRVQVVVHHPALPWEDLPGFMADLATRDALAARALEITILCATRTSETLQAGRGEIVGDLWTVPAARTKTGKIHRVPLSRQAAAVFAALPVHGAYLFPGYRDGRPLSGMAMEMLLRRMGRDDITVHGFRSTFRDWAAEQTNFPREIVELCLAHDISSEAERAYRRSDLLLKRRELMQAWADFAFRGATN